MSADGQALPDSVRSFFEPRLGHDLRRVRVQTGAEAARSASSLRANAYTVGSEIVFGGGQYAPHTHAGLRLLAHELTHVVQQAGGQGLGHRIGRAASMVQRQGAGGPLDLNPDVCVILPGFGQRCGQEAADLCKKLDLDCGPVCKLFDCKKPAQPKTPCPPGWRAATSSDFAGQCCKGGIDSAQACCPPSRISWMQDKCCSNDEVVVDNKCTKSSELPSGPPIGCLSFEKTLLGECCRFPLVPKGTVCVLPEQPPPQPPPSQPLPGTKAKVPDIRIGFQLDRPKESEANVALLSVTTPQGSANFAALVKQLMADPSAKVQLVGRASPEGSDTYNRGLGARRARIVAKALVQAGVAESRIADLPGVTLPAGCEPETLGPGLVTCGEAGAKGADDREVVAHVEGSASP